LIDGCNKERRDNYIKIFLAGGITEEYYCKKDLIEYNPEGSSSDHYFKEGSYNK
jgi:hypothetical protein